MRAIIGFLAMPLLLAVACQGGVPQADLDAAKTQTASESAKAAALQQQVSAELQKSATLQQTATAGSAVVAEKDKAIADLQKQLDAAKAGGGAPGVNTVLLGAKLVTPAPPRPTPTAVPPGYTPPPAATPPPSFTAPVQLAIYADTVTSGPGESPFLYDAAGITAPNCVKTGIFRRGMHMVWRFEVIDASTGKRLTTADVQSATVKLPDGQTVNGRFGRHGATDDAPWFWTAAWNVPLDYPLGVLDWTVNVTTKDGKVGTYKDWVVSTPARGIESRTQIVE